MKVYFYKTSSSLNTVNKTLTNQLEKTGKLLDDCSILQPRIQFAFNPVGYNYAYIPEFSRYYYVGNITNNARDLWDVPFNVDPLMSWADDIKRSPCIVAKNEGQYNLYLNDPNYKCLQDDIILHTAFPSGFDTQTQCYVLSIFGEKVAAT
jgi:hypothetical protein